MGAGRGPALAPLRVAPLRVAPQRVRNAPLKVRAPRLWSHQGGNKEGHTVRTGQILAQSSCPLPIYTQRQHTMAEQPAFLKEVEQPHHLKHVERVEDHSKPVIDPGAA